TGASTIHYDGFGNVRSSSGPLAALPAHGGPRFQGMWLDPEGLYYVRARTYDAETGRFITRDPIEGRVHRPESLSPYALSNANPYVYQDPTGLFSLRGTLTAAVARVNLLFTAVASQAQRFMRALQSVGRSVYGLVRGLPSLFRASRGGVQALGRGSTANLSTGTTLPRNLREHLAVEQVISNPTAGRVLPIRMTDSRWLASDGWVKMSQFVNSGGRAGPIQVHYVLNTITGAIDDLKIVLPGAR
ncbi:MAG: RHS repeat-associated core domain-containing protein, partial [Sandaracinaceae bacterium]